MPMPRNVPIGPVVINAGLVDWLLLFQLSEFTLTCVKSFWLLRYMPAVPSLMCATNTLLSEELAPSPLRKRPGVGLEPLATLMKRLLVKAPPLLSSAWTVANSPRKMLLSSVAPDISMASVSPVYCRTLMKQFWLVTWLEGGKLSWVVPTSSAMALVVPGAAVIGGSARATESP